MRTETQKDSREYERCLQAYARNVNLYARRCMRNMVFISRHDRNEIAADIASDFTEKLIREYNTDRIIPEQGSNVIAYVKNYLRRNDFTRFANRRIDSAHIEMEDLTISEEMRLTDSYGFYTLDGFPIFEDLSDVQKQMVSLKDYGYNWKEISKLLDMPRSTVSRMLSEIRVMINRRRFLGE